MYILTIILIVFIVLGLFISKEFRYGFITTIGSVIVFSPVIVIGLVYSKALNWVFRQKRHAIGSWERKLELKELKDRNLHGNIDKD